MRLEFGGDPKSSAPSIDADTYALWRMDETAMQQWFNCYDLGPDGLTLANIAGATNTNSPRPYPGALINSIGKQADAVNRNAGNQTNLGAYATALQNNWTVQAFVNADTIGTGCVIAYGDQGETEATNLQMSLQVGAPTGIAMLWDRGAGINIQFNQAAGPFPVAGQWHHIAVTKFLGPTNGDLTMYLDGAQVYYSSFNLGDNASGGSTGWWRWGLEPSNGNGYTGRAAYIKVSDYAMSGAEIAIAAARMNTSFDQPVDANTIALWPMNEQPDFVDACGRLPLCQNSLVTGSFVTLPLVNPAGRAKAFWNPSAGGGGQGSLFGNARDTQAWATALATVLRGDFSLDFWWKPAENVSNSTGRQIFSVSASGETVATNLMEIGLSNASGSQSYTLTVNWETGLGVDRSWAPAAVVTYPTIIPNGAVHIGVTKTTSNAGADCEWRCFVNGVQVATSGVLAGQNYDGTLTAADARLWIGGSQAGLVYLNGILDEVRLSSVARSAAFFLATYNAGKGVVAIRS